MSVLGGIDRRLFQNVDWPLLAAMTGLVILSATTLASLHIGRAGGNVAVRQELYPLLLGAVPASKVFQELRELLGRHLRLLRPCEERRRDEASRCERPEPAHGAEHGSVSRRRMIHCQSFSCSHGILPPVRPASPRLVLAG